MTRTAHLLLIMFCIQGAAALNCVSCSQLLLHKLSDAEKAQVAADFRNVTSDDCAGSGTLDWLGHHSGGSSPYVGDVALDGCNGTSDYVNAVCASTELWMDVVLPGLSETKSVGVLVRGCSTKPKDESPFPGKLVCNENKTSAMEFVTNTTVGPAIKDAIPANATGKVCYCITEACNPGTCAPKHVRMAGYCFSPLEMAIFVLVAIVLLALVTCCCCCCCCCCCGGFCGGFCGGMFDNCCAPCCGEEGDELIL